MKAARVKFLTSGRFFLSRYKKGRLDQREVDQIERKKQLGRTYIGENESCYTQGGLKN